MVGSPRLPHRRRTFVRAAVLAFLLAVLAATVAAVRAGSAGDGVSGGSAVSEAAFRVDVGPEPDGDPVSLDVSVFTPTSDAPGADQEGRRAAVVLAHGFGGSKSSVAAQAGEVAAQGYVVLTYTARGFGDSGGLIHLDSPDYEVADVSVLLDLIATRDDVRLDASGDPRVGIAGGSYGGALALMAAAYDDRVDAIVPAITWNDLSEGLFPGGVFKQRWAALFFAGGLAGSQGDPCGRFDPRICELYDAAASTGLGGQEIVDLLKRSSPASVLGRISAPTLLIQGETDSLFGLDQADANARGIAAAGTAIAVRWIDGGHDASGLDGDSDLTGAALDWFDHYLRGGPSPDLDFQFSLPGSVLAPQEVERLATATYGDVEPVTLPLAGSAGSGQAQPLISPAGGQPASVTSLPGTGSLLGAAAQIGGAGYRLGVLAGESAVFDSEPFADTVTVAGGPKVRLSITSSTSDATLFASLWVVDAGGDATLPRQLVAPLRLDGLTPGQAEEVDVALPWSAYRVESGQRLRVVVSSTDAAYAVPSDARTYRIALLDNGAGGLELPRVNASRVAGTGGLAPTPLVIAVLVLLLGAGGVALVSRRRQRVTDTSKDLGDVPLVVSGLVKEYSNGFRAVDDISWRAQRGQVVGLLGPNGAGKTTTMRMLVGLIRPDRGRVWVLGQEVRAGSAVLARVGALIEGPGFLPHLTGRENLQSYWAATGRPSAEADFDDALATADLGVAIDKPVRSYSQGMRQRLGIAQAMLGRPELLLLDEPTNGLDPPQIRAMRDVLRKYAAGGRTVVVSSHLLSEVEQTCSHVVVMHRGRVLLEGAVDELVAESESTLVAVEGDPVAARDVLAGLDGVTDADLEADGRLRVRGTAPRPELVAALVGAGVGVDAVDGRRHLEEVFMALVGDDRPAQIEPDGSGQGQ